MALYERIVGKLDDGEPLPDSMEKIPVHQLMAALNEWGRGFLTRAQVINGFNIEPSEEASLDFIAGKWTSYPGDKERYELRQTCHDCFLLGESSTIYDQSADFVARLNAQFP
jgi:hypothetical protein